MYTGSAEAGGYSDAVWTGISRGTGIRQVQ